MVLKGSGAASRMSALEDVLFGRGAGAPENEEAAVLLGAL